MIVAGGVAGGTPAQGEGAYFAQFFLKKKDDYRLSRFGNLVLARRVSVYTARVGGLCILPSGGRNCSRSDEIAQETAQAPNILSLRKKAPQGDRPPAQTKEKCKYQKYHDRGE